MPQPWWLESLPESLPGALSSSQPSFVVLSTTGDAPTPLVNAVDVAASLGHAGLVTVDDDGHTAYGRNFCVNRIVADYFATGAVPPTVHRC